MLTNSACSKNSKSALLAGLAILCFNVYPPPVLAQEGATPSLPVPSEESLSQVEEEEDASEGENSSASQETETAATEEEDLKVDPCPLPAAEMANTPDDLAKIQSDIDRYTLCMERAQLLERLNEIALENQQKLQEASGISTENPGMQLDKNLPDFDQQRQQVMQTIENTTDSLSREEEPEPEDDEWKIQKILGSAGNLSAQLGLGDGTIVRVKTGDTLPDGSMIKSISATSVSINQNGDAKNLQWIDTPADEGRS